MLYNILMAQDSEFTETYDFGYDRIYDADEIAQLVIWPLVHHLNGEDWFQASIEKAQPLNRPRRGTYAGKIYDLSINASTESFPARDVYEIPSEHGLKGDTPVPHFLAALAVEQIIDAPDNSNMLRTAREIISQMSAEDEEGSNIVEGFDDIPLDEWLNKSTDMLTMKRGIRYTCHQTGMSEAEIYRVVQDPYGRLELPIWSHEADKQGEQQWLRQHDLAIIEAACVIFDAPQALLQTIKSIQKNPSDTPPIRAVQAD